MGMRLERKIYKLLPPQENMIKTDNDTINSFVIEIEYIVSVNEISNPDNKEVCILKNEN